MATVTTRRKRQKEPPTIPPPGLPLYNFSVEQYHQMIDAGVFDAGGRVELLEGWIVAKMTKNPPHGAAITRLNRLLTRLLPDEWVVRIQDSLSIGASEPEPDVTVVRGPLDRYDAHHPQPRDTALVVEVADSSLDQDRGYKLRMCARARLVLYWIVNLQDSQIEVYTEPRRGRTPHYRRRQDYNPTDDVPLVLAGHDFGTIPVRELLP
jgi:Uma2 family endonuclease